MNTLHDLSVANENTEPLYPEKEPRSYDWIWMVLTVISLPWFAIYAVPKILEWMEAL